MLLLDSIVLSMHVLLSHRCEDIESILPRPALWHRDLSLRASPRTWLQIEDPTDYGYGGRHH